jgi:hypothetical protein
LHTGLKFNPWIDPDPEHDVAQSSLGIREESRSQAAMRSIVPWLLDHVAVEPAHARLLFDRHSICCALGRCLQALQKLAPKRAGDAIEMQTGTAAMRGGMLLRSF